MNVYLDSYSEGAFGRMLLLNTLEKIGADLGVTKFFDLQFTPLAPNIFFCVSNHQGDAFLFFLLLSFPSFVLQWHH